MEWYHDFCLFCDRQTAEGAYCSQACRVADLEKCGYSEPQTPSGSPTSASGSWNFQQSSSSSLQFRLPPALNFDAFRATTTRLESPPISPRNVQPQQSASYFTSSSSTSTSGSSTTAPKHRLTSSSSRSSLASISSTSTTCTAQGLSDQTYSQLRDYSNSFDHVRDWKRRVTLS